MTALHPATPNDTSIIAATFQKFTGRQLNETLLNLSLKSFPSAIWKTHDDIQAFAYCGMFAPDILELKNIFVVPEMRSHGIGAKMLSFIESIVSPHIHSIIVVNSMRYQTNEVKRPATQFYEQNGYRMVLRTGETWVLAKPLRAPFHV